MARFKIHIERCNKCGHRCYFPYMFGYQGNNFWFIEIHQTNVNESPWPGNLESNRQQLAELFQRHGYQTESVIHDQLFAWKQS